MGGKETGYSVVPHQATLVLYCVYSSAQQIGYNFFFLILMGLVLRKRGGGGICAEQHVF